MGSAMTNKMQQHDALYRYEKEYRLCSKKDGSYDTNIIS